MKERLFNTRIYNSKGNQENPERITSDTERICGIYQLFKTDSRALGEK